MILTIWQTATPEDKRKALLIALLLRVSDVHSQLSLQGMRLEKFYFANWPWKWNKGKNKIYTGQSYLYWQFKYLSFWAEVNAAATFCFLCFSRGHTTCFASSKSFIASILMSAVTVYSNEVHLKSSNVTRPFARQPAVKAVRHGRGPV